MLFEFGERVLKLVDIRPQVLLELLGRQAPATTLAV
jgi:hypothetical protein